MKVIPKIGTGPMITHLLQGNHQVRSNQHNHCHLPKDFLPLCWYLLAKMCNKEIKCLKNLVDCTKIYGFEAFSQQWDPA